MSSWMEEVGVLFEMEVLRCYFLGCRRRAPGPAVGSRSRWVLVVVGTKTLSSSVSRTVVVAAACGDEHKSHWTV